MAGGCSNSARPSRSIRSPSNRIVADFMGLVNFVPGRIGALGGGQVEIEGEGGCCFACRRARRSSRWATASRSPCGPRTSRSHRLEPGAIAGTVTRAGLPRQSSANTASRFRAARAAGPDPSAAAVPGGEAVAITVDAEPVQHLFPREPAPDVAAWPLPPRSGELDHEPARHVQRRVSAAGALDQEGRRRSLPVREICRRRPPTRRARSCSCTARRWPRSRPSTCRCRAAPDSSVMDWFAKQGYDTWCVDMEGYGRSTKTRDITCNIADGADDLAAASDYIMKLRGNGPFLVYGISSGALRAAAFAERHPERVRRLALDAFVWTGEGSPTLEERKKKLPQFQAMKRRPIDRAFVHSIFNRDHPGTADARDRRGLRRRDPGARRLDADRHLCRHVLAPAADRSGEDHCADHHHARRIRRHRQLRGSDRVLRKAAESRQAVRRSCRASRTPRSSRRTT